MLSVNSFWRGKSSLSSGRKLRKWRILQDKQSELTRFQKILFARRRPFVPISLGYFEDWRNNSNSEVLCCSNFAQIWPSICLREAEMCFWHPSFGNQFLSQNSEIFKLIRKDHKLSQAKILQLEPALPGLITTIYHTCPIISRGLYCRHSLH